MPRRAPRSASNGTDGNVDDGSSILLARRRASPCRQAGTGHGGALQIVIRAVAYASSTLSCPSPPHGVVCRWQPLVRAWLSDVRLASRFWLHRQRIAG